ncbi:MAG: hypothetical protein KDI79_17290 [Anaerolineae bacterium]|nr:hypothetical protein [Anaerolineae bacterium]
MLKLKLFGPGQAEYLYQTLGGFPNQQCHYLLCYLAINRNQAHARERLAMSLWEEHQTNNPRKQLRNALWRLRQALLTLGGVSIENYLIISDESIAFNVGSSYWLDIENFEKAVEPYLDIPGEVLSAEQILQLEQALELYTGDLLEGVYEDWCLYEREWLRKLYFAGLVKLLDYFGSQNNYERAIIFGKKILDYDPVQERIHRRVMWLYWQMGDRNAARIQYQRCVQILRDELDVPPMPETEQLYQRLLSNGHHQNYQRNASILRKSSQPSLDQYLVKHIWQQLQQLKSTVDEANQEIHRLEALFQQILPYDER